MDDLEELELYRKNPAIYDNEKVQRKLQNSARLEGYLEGYKKGFTMGVAKRMLEAGESPDKVSKYLNLSQEDIKKIISDIKD